MGSSVGTLAGAAPSVPAAGAAFPLVTGWSLGGLLDMTDSKCELFESVRRDWDVASKDGDIVVDMSRKGDAPSAPPTMPATGEFLLDNGGRYSPTKR